MCIRIFAIVTHRRNVCVILIRITIGVVVSVVVGNCICLCRDDTQSRWIGWHVSRPMWMRHSKCQGCVVRKTVNDWRGRTKISGSTSAQRDGIAHGTVYKWYSLAPHLSIWFMCVYDSRVSDDWRPVDSGIFMLEVNMMRFLFAATATNDDDVSFRFRTRNRSVLFHAINRKCETS